MSFTTTTKTTKYENDALEVSIAKSLAEILSSESCNLERLTIASIVDRLEQSLERDVAEEEKKIKRTKKKYVRFMVQAHIDENHPQHEKAKRGEPITSATLIEEEEKREMNSKKKKKKRSDVDSDTDTKEGADKKYYDETNDARRYETDEEKRKKRKREKKRRSNPNPKARKDRTCASSRTTAIKSSKSFPGLNSAKSGRS